MKLSRWNSYISLGEKSGLIYNSLTDSFVAVKETSDDFIHASRGETALFSERFHEQMCVAGALVEDDIDEVKRLEELIYEVDNDDKLFHLIVNPTLDCNLHCWYCYENHVKDSCMNPETIDAVIRLVKSRVEESEHLKYFQLSFFGGEPLLRFNEVVRPLIDRISEICDNRGIKPSVHFTTNAVLIDDDMLSYLKAHNTSFQITLDGGRENHDNTRFSKGKTGTFDTILENIKRLTLAGMYVNLRINYTRKNIDSTSEVADILAGFPTECREHMGVDYQRVWQDSTREDVEEMGEKLKLLKKRLNDKGYKTSDSHLSDYVRSSCYGDKRNELVVNYNGDVFACTARDFTRDNRLGVLSEDGRVVWNEGLREMRMNAKLKKEVCRRCQIAPQCAGGCRTKCLEQSHHDNCNLGYSHEDIENLVLERFEKRYIHA